MPGVFISYRRQDSAGHTGRLFDRLQARLGGGRVFMDTTAIEPGVDFVHSVEHAVGSCDVLLAVIGPDWLACTNADGHRRLNDPDDFIRLEISAALNRNIRVIPVLVAGASIPQAAALPDALKSLSRRQMVELRDTRWDVDTNDLAVTLEGLLGTHPGGARTAGKRKLAFLLAGSLAVLLAIALPVTRRLARPDPPAPAAASAPATPERSLDYAITLRRNPGRYPGSAPLQVSEGSTFSPGDLVRFSFSSPQPGFLYVINEGPPDDRQTASFNILFPSSTSNNGSARLAAGQVVPIPEKGEGFELDAEEGTEKLWLVWSVVAIDALEDLKRWANRQDQGEIKDSHEIDALRTFFARHLSPAPGVQQHAEPARTTLTRRADILVKLVTLEHRR